MCVPRWRQPGVAAELGSVDSHSGRPHGSNVKHVFLLLLLLGAVAGLTLQPAQALVGPLGAIPMATAIGGDMAAMHDCHGATPKDATPAPCKCGIAGCLAMMASDAPMMRAEGMVPITGWASSRNVEHHLALTVLSGRTTTPEPEPPSALI